MIHVTKGEEPEAQRSNEWAVGGCTGIQTQHFQKHAPEKATYADYQ